MLSTKVNLLHLFYSMSRRCCLLSLIKQKYLLKTFLRTLLLMTRVSLYLFNIPITPKMVQNVLTNLHSSKASGPDGIPVVVLKKCDLIFLTFWLNSSISVSRGLVFQIVGRSHRWSLYLRILGKGLQLKATVLLVFFL